MTTLVDRALAFTGAHEGNFPGMYLCPAGKVTVGVGSQLPFVETALLLPFEPRESVAADYATVKALPVGHVASWYQTHTTSRLSGDAIRALFEVQCSAFIASLERAFPDWQHYPEPAKLGLIDIAFNVGMREFLSWSHLNAAVRARDWATCAAQCHRKPPVSEARNEATAALFREAASRA